MVLSPPILEARAPVEFGDGGLAPFPSWRRVLIADRRTVNAVAHVSLVELADWRTKVAVADVPLSAVLWQAVARTRTWTAPAAAVERERTLQVERIANNLTQIAHWANTYASAAEAVEIVVALGRHRAGARGAGPRGAPGPRCTFSFWIAEKITVPFSRGPDHAGVESGSLNMIGEHVEPDSVRNHIAGMMLMKTNGPGAEIMTLRERFS